MASKDAQRRKMIVGALVVTLAAVYWLDEEESASIHAVAAEPPAQAQKAPAADKPGDLDLDVLQRRSASRKPKDVFGSKSWYVPPPPPKVVNLPPPPPAPPPMPFSYIGRMVEEGKTVVFLSRPDRSFAVKVGDIIDGMYRVDAVNPGGVTFTYLPLDMQQTLPMGGSR